MLAAAIAANWARDVAYMVHAFIIMGVSAGLFFWTLRTIPANGTPIAPRPSPVGYMDGPVRAGVIATAFWGLAGFLVGTYIAFSTGVPGPRHRVGVALRELRTASATAYLCGDLRLRGQRPDRVIVLYRAADLRREALGWQRCLVRLLRLQPVHRSGLDRLSAGGHTIEGIRRA